MTGKLRRAAGRGLRKVLRSGQDLPTRPVVVETAVEPGSDLALVVGSPLFDDRWYATQTGVARTRTEAARHYLDNGDSPRPLPHPLFDPDYYAARLPVSLAEALGDGDPFVFYLRKQTRLRPTSPLFDVDGYVARSPESRDHPDGPLAHYLEVGASAGLLP